MPLLAVPLAAAACGGNKSGSSSTVTLPEDPVAAVKGAAAKTVQAGSEHVAISVSVAARGQQVRFKGSGDFDTKQHLGSLHGDFSVGGLNGSLEEVSSGADAYVKSDLLSALVPGGKTWVKVDLAKTAKAEGLNITSFLSQDPTQALTQLEGLRDVTKVQVRAGSTLAHYRARLDLSTLKGTATTGAGRNGTGRYDVWIGDDGYVHEVATIVKTAGTTSTITTELSAFGEPVDVTIPKAADTFDGTTATIPGLGG